MARAENIKALNKLEAPVFKIESKDTGNAENIDRADFGYIEKTLYLCKGARVVINKNINTRMGIYNAAQGIIEDIIFVNDKPTYLIIDLDKSSLSRQESFEGVHHRVVISRERVTPTEGKATTRTQFPVNLAYAMTIHKVQGQTLDKVIIDFGARKPNYGLSLVALSRTRKLKDLTLRNVNIDDMFILTRASVITRNNQTKVLNKIRQNIAKRTGTNVIEDEKIAEFEDIEQKSNQVNPLKRSFEAAFGSKQEE